LCDKIEGSVALGKMKGMRQRLPVDEDQIVNFSPCTPLGIIELLDRSNISLEGKHVVVLGNEKLRFSLIRKEGALL
jgi:hypothetical protein